MKKISLSLSLGYAVSSITFFCGVAVVSGLVPLERIPDRLRFTFGAVLILWGIYRFVGTQAQRRRRGMEDSEE
jgi:hypothetical protein